MNGRKAGYRIQESGIRNQENQKAESSKSGIKDYHDVVAMQRIKDERLKNAHSTLCIP
jgi:hypothetical protein